MVKVNRQGTVTIILNSSRCKKCGICHGFCPQGVFTLAKDGTPLVTDQDKCNYCRMCELRCPDFAIELEVKA